ncbi:MAG: aminoacyl--tRNA ligase-related protein [Anaerolineaceae bacterium]
MSHGLYGVETLRFYNEEEIEFREMMTKVFTDTVKRTLVDMNKAWRIHRVEGPLLTPRSFVSSSYTEDDIFETQVEKMSQKLVLRPETTASTYQVARGMIRSQKQLPACFWQVGRVFAVEKADGATASKLRFNEFSQQEFQCIYALGTHDDYRSALMDALIRDMKMFMRGETGIRIVESDRLPEYSETTLDIEIEYHDAWKEVASCSIRHDFSEDTRNCEIAIGLDRLIAIRNGL